MEIYETLMYVYMAMSIFLLLTLMKNTIYKKMFGKRFLDYVIVDTGEIGKILFPKDFSTSKTNGIIRCYNKERVYKDTIYYESDNAEPLAIEKNNKKCSYYCNTSEFDTIFNNKILQMIMYIKEKNILIICAILSGLAVLGIAILWSKIGNIEESVNFLVQNSKVIT